MGYTSFIVLVLGSVNSHITFVLSAFMPETIPAGCHKQTYVLDSTLMS